MAALERAIVTAPRGQAVRAPFLGAAWDAHQGRALGTLAVLAVVGTWEGVARMGVVSPLFLSSPYEVWVTLASLFTSGAIWPHVAVSAQEIGLGLGLAAAVGIPVGILMGQIPAARHVLEPLLMAKYSSPTVAFLPLLIIWFGIGLGSKVVLIFLGAVVVIIVNTEAGVSSVEWRLVEAVRAYTASEWQVLRKVVLPSSVPFIVSGLRLAVGRALIMMVVAEMFASTSGLGHLVFEGAARYDTSLVFAGVVLLAGTGILANEGLRGLERRLAPWRQSERLRNGASSQA